MTTLKRGDRAKVVKVEGGAPDGLVGKVGEITSAHPEDGYDIRFDAVDLPSDAGGLRTWSFETGDVEPA